MTAEQAIAWLSRKPKSLPVFVLLGTDPLAPGAIAKWVRLAEWHRVNRVKTEEARTCEITFLQYPTKRMPG